MKIENILYSNKKGQIVIPKKFREALKIDSNLALKLVLRDKSILIYPVKDVITSNDFESSYLNLLKKTRGTWKNEKLGVFEKRRESELKASKRRKELW